MVDGQSGKLKIGAVIQARIKSTRLPGKILKPLPFPDGKPLLGWVVDGAKKSRLVNRIILATSSGTENDSLEKFSSDNQISLVRGEEDDVLSRFVKAIQEYELDMVVRLTGDNPFFDHKILDEAIEFHITQENDYTVTAGLPIGMNFEIVTAATLVDLLHRDLTLEDKEHVTFFLRRTNIFKKNILTLTFEEELSALRLTVDYPSDFAMASLALALAGNHAADVSLVKKLLRSWPWIFEINYGNEQRKQFENSKDEIQAAISALERSGMTRAASILLKYGSS